ncbi:MAG: hypothetical protein ACYCXA_12515 [Actinomycetes bacterium]
MTTIKASCPDCGDVELTPRQLRLVVCNHAPWSFYSFACPACRVEVRKSADREIITLLVGGAVVAEPWYVPAEALEEHRGSALTVDDILDFALDLGRTDQLARELVTAPGR